jgi:hypothetical protein
MGRAGTSFFHSLLTSHLLSRSSVSIFVGFITYSDSLIALSEIGSWDVIILVICVNFFLRYVHLCLKTKNKVKLKLERFRVE